jgi:drug/metabolite transporter (DMT)-like permease
VTRQVNPRSSSFVWFVWLITCLLWSTVWLAIKVGVTAIPPFTFAYLRLLVALAVLAPFAAVRGRLGVTTRADAAVLVTTGVLLLGANYALVFWGARLVPSGLVAVLQSATPLWGLTLAAACGLERATPGKIAGVLLGMAGVTLISLHQAVAPSEAGAVRGCIAVVAGTVCVAVAYVAVKLKRPQADPATVICWQMMAGAVPLIVLGTTIEGSPAAMAFSGRAVAAIVYLALAGSVAAFWLNYWLLQRLDASAVLLIGVAEAPPAAVWGALVLGERFDASMIAGSFLVLAGSALVIGLASRRGPPQMS